MDQEYTDRTIMPFGKYKGKALANIPAPYLLYLYNEGIARDALKRYIEDNMKVLNNEVKLIPKRKF